MQFYSLIQIIQITFNMSALNVTFVGEQKDKCDNILDLSKSELNGTFAVKMMLFPAVLEYQQILHDNRSTTTDAKYYYSCISYVYKVDTALLYLYIVGYTISTFALLIAITLFRYCPSLRCPRTRIHCHLFISYALSNFLSIVRLIFVLNNSDVLKEDPMWCQVLALINIYFLMTNYCWTLFEIIQMYYVLIKVIPAYEGLNNYVYVSWIVPFYADLVYAFLRFNTKEYSRCWLKTYPVIDVFEYFAALATLTPTLVCLGKIAFLIYAHIKQRTQEGNQLHVVLKTLKATLLLVPLFGLQFFLEKLVPSPSSSYEYVYQICCALISSFKGLYLANLFCFNTRRVQAAIKRHHHRRQMVREVYEIEMTGVTTQGR